MSRFNGKLDVVVESAKKTLTKKRDVEKLERDLRERKRLQREASRSIINGNTSPDSET